MSNWTRVTNFATNKYTLGAAVGLAGLAAGVGLTYSLMKDGEVKIPKPENVRVFEVSEDYTGVLVEPNGYFISISEKGELFGVNISKEKTPFVETEVKTTVEGRDLGVRKETLEESLEVFGTQMVVKDVEKTSPGDPDVPRVSFKLKRK